MALPSYSDFADVHAPSQMTPPAGRNCKQRSRVCRALLVNMRLRTSLITIMTAFASALIAQAQADGLVGAVNISVVIRGALPVHIFNPLKTPTPAYIFNPQRQTAIPSGVSGRWNRTGSKVNATLPGRSPAPIISNEKGKVILALALAVYVHS